MPLIDPTPLWAIMASCCTGHRHTPAKLALIALSAAVGATACLYRCPKTPDRKKEARGVLWPSVVWLSALLPIKVVATKLTGLL